jgi:formylglycine-generating enzyme required for sulfatase activity
MYVRRSGWLLVVVTLVLAGSAPAFAAGRPRVAVMEIEDRSGTLKARLRGDLTEYLRVQLTATGRYVVIDKTRQAKALKRLVSEQQKESYKQCYAESCQIPLGQALSADSILRTTVTRIGGIYAISAELVDLEKQASMGAAVEECEGEPKRRRDRRLMQAVKRLVAKLPRPGEGGKLVSPAARPASSTGSPVVPPPPPPVGGGGPTVSSGEVTEAKGELIVSVKPKKGVRLDLTDPKGKGIASGVPYRNQRAPVGRWKVLARAQGYEDLEQSFDVPPDELTPIKLELRPLGGLVVEGKPKGARVEVTGPGGFSNTGGLRWEANGLRSGRYRVVVTRKGYAGYNSEVEVRPGEVARVSVVLKKERASKKSSVDRAERGRAGMEWVSLPGGSFRMGSEEGQADEKPVRRVTLGGFEMARTETTVGQYRACVEAGACRSPHWDDGACYVWTGGGTGKGVAPSSLRGERQPIVCVDWHQAKAFCEWAGGRLPTEAEWEYAARSGGKAKKYPWGDATATCARAVMNEGSGIGCGKDRTWPVCSKPAGNTEQGLCDMAGNVWEWVSDWKGAYPAAGQTNPGGPRSGSARVTRGGFGIVPSTLRAANRNSYPPGFADVVSGFRCARSSP